MSATEHLCWPPDIYCGHWIDGQILADGGTLGKRKPWDSGKFGWSRFDQDVVGSGAGEYGAVCRQTGSKVTRNGVCRYCSRCWFGFNPQSLLGAERLGRIDGCSTTCGYVAGEEG